MAEPMLELRHVSKQFGATVPADDVSLAIEACPQLERRGLGVDAGLADADDRRSAGAALG